MATTPITSQNCEHAYDEAWDLVCEEASCELDVSIAQEATPEFICAEGVTDPEEALEQAGKQLDTLREGRARLEDERGRLKSRIDATRNAAAWTSVANEGYGSELFLDDEARLQTSLNDVETGIQALGEEIELVEGERQEEAERAATFAFQQATGRSESVDAALSYDECSPDFFALSSVARMHAANGNPQRAADIASRAATKIGDEYTSLRVEIEALRAAQSTGAAVSDDVLQDITARVSAFAKARDTSDAQVEELRARLHAVASTPSRDLMTEAKNRSLWVERSVQGVRVKRAWIAAIETDLVRDLAKTPSLVMSPGEFEVGGQSRRAKAAAHVAAMVRKLNVAFAHARPFLDEVDGRWYPKLGAIDDADDDIVALWENMAGLAAQIYPLAKIYSLRPLDGIREFERTRNAFPGSEAIARVERSMTVQFPVLSDGRGHLKHPDDFGGTDQEASSNAYAALANDSDPLIDHGGPIAGMLIGGAACNLPCAAIGGLLGEGLVRGGEYLAASDEIEQASITGLRLAPYEFEEASYDAMETRAAITAVLPGGAKLAGVAFRGGKAALGRLLPRLRSVPVPEFHIPTPPLLPAEAGFTATERAFFAAGEAASQAAATSAELAAATPALAPEAMGLGRRLVFGLSRGRYGAGVPVIESAATASVEESAEVLAARQLALRIWGDTLGPDFMRAVTPWMVVAAEEEARRRPFTLVLQSMGRTWNRALSSAPGQVATGGAAAIDLSGMDGDVGIDHPWGAFGLLYFASGHLSRPVFGLPRVGMDVGATLGTGGLVLFQLDKGTSFESINWGYPVIGGFATMLSSAFFYQSAVHGAIYLERAALGRVIARGLHRLNQVHLDVPGQGRLVLTRGFENRTWLRPVRDIPGAVRRWADTDAMSPVFSLRGAAYATLYPTAFMWGATYLTGSLQHVDPLNTANQRAFNVATFNATFGPGQARRGFANGYAQAWGRTWGTGLNLLSGILLWNPFDNQQGPLLDMKAMLAEYTPGKTIPFEDQRVFLAKMRGASSRRGFPNPLARVYYEKGVDLVHDFRLRLDSKLTGAFNAYADAVLRTAEMDELDERNLRTAALLMSLTPSERDASFNAKTIAATLNSDSVGTLLAARDTQGYLAFEGESESDTEAVNYEVVAASESETAREASEGEAASSEAVLGE